MFTRRFSLVLTASLAVMTAQLWQSQPATAAGTALCGEVGVANDAVSQQVVESPDACPQVDRSIITGVVPPDPGIWNALPPTAKDVFRVARVTQGPNVIVPNVGTSVLPPSAGGTVGEKADCGGFTVTVRGENAFGEPLWTYGQKLSGCFDGGKFVSVKRARWGETMAAGWTFEGHIGNAKTGRAGSSSIRRYTKGRFSFGAAYVFLQYEEPWIDMTITASGGRTWDSGR